MKQILITGGAGFIGLNLVNFLIKKKYEITIIDSLKYSSNKEHIEKLKNKITFYKNDISDYRNIEKIIHNKKPDIIFHLAAESHVDRSIENPKNFIDTNIFGTFNLLHVTNEYLKKVKQNKRKLFKFIHISTDEVFGDLGKLGKFSEKSNYLPNSPYSASKASSDMLVRAWNKTFNFPSIICNCSNNYGPFQHPEKLIPNIILRSIKKMPIEIYGRGNNERDWLYVEDHINALFKVMLKGRPGNIYVIGTGKTYTNINIAKKIIKNLKNNKLFISNFGKFESNIIFVKDRPGHDFRYSVNSAKIKKNLKWKCKNNLDVGLNKTINWYLTNIDWFSNKLNSNYKLNRLGVKY